MIFIVIYLKKQNERAEGYITWEGYRYMDIKTETGYAPVMIATLNRHTHLKRCIDSLQRNRLAPETELYISLDYPPNEKYFQGYEETKHYLQHEIGNGFKKIYLFIQEENLGPIQNFIFLRSEIYKKYNKYICSEDDNEFSLNYLEYMNKALDYYEHDAGILAVTGYNYPISISNMAGNIYTNPLYFSAFGYGIWKEKEQAAISKLTLKNMTTYYKNRRMMDTLCRLSPNQYCNFVKGMVGYIPELISNEEVQQIDLSYGLYMFFENKNMVFPVESKVRNWGFDGSGVHCSDNFSEDAQNDTYHVFQYAKQKIDEKEEFGEMILAHDLQISELSKKLNDFFYIPPKEMARTKIAYWISRIIGRKCTYYVLRVLTGRK